MSIPAPDMELRHKNFKGPLYFARGQCYEKLGKLELAQSDFELATQCGVNPTTPVQITSSEGKEPAKHSAQPGLQCSKCLSQNMQESAYFHSIHAMPTGRMVPISMFFCRDCGYVEFWVKDQVFLQQVREFSSRKLTTKI